MIFDNESSKKYWENRFKEAYDAHSQQNKQISTDFFINIKKHQKFNNVLNKSCSIIEIGCGTGEFCKQITEIYNGKNILGTDISQKAIEFANKNYSNNKLNFEVFDSLNNNIENIGKFDLTVSSNTLEHFKNPFLIIDNMLKNSKKCLILVPFEQPCTDGYDKEGGAGHVFTFYIKSFISYKILDFFTFETSGWQYSSLGEKPLQLAILLKGKIDDD